MRERYRAIARVEKTHGRKGEVVTVPVHGLPLVLDTGMEVFVVPPSLKGPRSFVVTSCSDGPTGQLISLKGVGDLDTASALVSKTLLVRADDLPDDFDLMDTVSLLGREVTDLTYGPLGTIVQVMQGTAQDVWVIQGEQGETLMPAVAELVVSLGPDGPIEVDLPQGLVARDGE